MSIRRVALIGYGEVGRILAADLTRRGVEVVAYDVVPGRVSASAAEAASAVEAVRGADLVVSAVTAANTEAAARAAAPGLAAGTFYLDLNSASPGQKIAAAEAVEAVGGRYVEAAVMTPYPPKGIASRTLVGGPHAAALAPLLAPLDFDVSVFSETLGQASAAKMCRSVMIKGVEALLAESLLAARHYGVEETVLASLGDLLPHPDWEKQARYMISRSLEHGTRRAEEMREAARTVGEAGVEPLMSAACARRQDWAAGRASPDDKNLAALLDAIIAAQ
jgi:3-hydroxyisobutyrate dehydrogenase-like beta-hydroxyacid dehydrogenase